MPEIPELQARCPVDLVLHILGNKWSISILRDLLQGEKRTSELMRSLVGISPRTLSERLRELEDWGLITRTVYAEIPPRVEYALTDMGQDLHAVMLQLKLLGERWQRRFGKEAVSTRGCSHCGKPGSRIDCPAVSNEGEEAQDSQKPSPTIRSRNLNTKTRKSK